MSPRRFLQPLRNVVGRAIVRSVESTVLDADYAQRFNRANRRWGHPYSLDFDEARQFFIVTSDEVRFAVPRRSRLRKVGDLQARRRQLNKVYLLDDIGLSRQDIVIDIGANIGEFSMLATDVHEARVIAFEPDDLEFRALEWNLRCRSGEAIHRLLWSDSSDVSFFSANESGDSSVFRPGTAKRSERRQGTTLDEAMTRSSYPTGRIKLIKLEAEGAEPEVLQGAEQTLARTEFVTADLGPERGPEQKTTLVDALEILQSHDFAPINFFASRCVMLFKKR